MLDANSSIVRAQRALWRQPADCEAALAALQDAQISDYFRNDPVLARVIEHLQQPLEDAEKRIEILRLLESRSLLSQYMTRSRKREVLDQRVERGPQTLSVSFSPAETALYDRVTEHIRAQAFGKSGVSLFSLIARQRQMASSIVGALESWRERTSCRSFSGKTWAFRQSLIAGLAMSSRQRPVIRTPGIPTGRWHLAAGLILRNLSGVMPNTARS